MKLITKEQERRLLNNGRWKATGTGAQRFCPVVRLFCPWNAATWWLTELDPDNPDIASGLVDLGMGRRESSSFRLSELQSMVGPGGLRIMRYQRIRNRGFRRRRC
jgi:hypothetical protein